MLTNQSTEFVWQLPHSRLTWECRPLIMGIVNVTPDSFSDGGKYATIDKAVEHGMELVEQGADILDVGGESTRPGAAMVSVYEELRRVRPVIEKLKSKIDVPISVDTSKAHVAHAGIDSGAAIINDVTALTGDPEMVSVARETKAGVVLMHMQGNPRTMQQQPVYGNVVEEICAYLRQRTVDLEQAGLAPETLVIDPGIGFGKTLEHNLALLRRLDEFQKLNRPLCLGVSRKGFGGTLLNRPVDQRLYGSLAVLCHAMSKNAVQIIRVHDVAATLDVVTMWQALR